MKTYQNRPFVLLGVNSDRDLGKARALKESGEINWNNWVDGGTDGPITSRWGVEAWPSVFLIDHQGVVRARGHHGDDALIEELVKKAEAAAP